MDGLEPQTATLDYSTVAFLDVLGFSAMVEHDSRGTPKYLPIFIHAIEQVNDSIANKAVEVKMFSDSIVLSAALNPQNVVDVALAVSELQRCFLREGILLRGGIA